MADEETDPRRVVAYIDRDTFQKLKLEATFRETSMTDIIQRSLTRWLEEEGHDLALTEGQE